MGKKGKKLNAAGKKHPPPTLKTAHKTLPTKQPFHALLVYALLLSVVA